jgi:hypothetical protein
MEKPEYFIVNPSTKLFGGIKVKKDTEFETYNDDKTVHQTLKNLVLTTEIKRESNYNGIKSTEESKMVTQLPENIVLVWGEQEGYIVPNYVMVKPSEAIKILKKINRETKAIEAHNNEVLKKEEREKNMKVEV